MFYIFIQARMSSMRLPKKVLFRIGNKPLLQFLIDRLSFLKFDNDIVVATSNDREDDKIVEYCSSNKINYYRGSLNNPSKRILEAIKAFKADNFVRICGDSPLIDPEIIDKAVEIYRNNEFDLVTNTFPRSFPVGQSVEVIKTSTFKKAYNRMTKAEEFEHVTKYYYNHTNEFQIRNFQNERDLSNYRLVVDTPKDLKRMEKIIGSMTKPHTDYSLDELIELYPAT